MDQLYKSEGSQFEDRLIQFREHGGDLRGPRTKRIDKFILFFDKFTVFNLKRFYRRSLITVYFSYFIEKNVFLASLQYS